MAQRASTGLENSSEDRDQPSGPPARPLHRSVAGDTVVQSEVLENLSLAVNYRNWIVELSRPWLGDAPLEIGSGTGDYAQAWADLGHAITVSEADPLRLAELRSRFDSRPDVTVRELAVPIDEDGDYTGAVAVNVLEHIEDDVQGLRTFARLTRPGGHIVLFVPAFSFAMSDFDREVGHFRRYRKKALNETLVAAGLEPVVVHYVNSVGLFGWTLLVKMLHGRPRDGVVLMVMDRLIIPVLRRVESRIRPPFGQSLFAVARVPQPLS